MREAMSREFWLHVPTGRLWAVESRDGVVVAAAGPLEAADVHPRLLDHLMFFRSDADRVNAHRHDFIPLGCELASRLQKA